MSKKIYFIRHGQTEWNTGIPRIQGRSDIPLNDIGRKQAQQTAEFFKNHDFDVIFHSPLVRAKETAQLIYRQQDQNRTKLVEEQLLIEMSFGDDEGKTHEQVYGNNNQDLIDVQMDRKIFPNGEKLQDVQNRLWKLLDNIIIAQKDSSNSWCNH